MRSLWITRITAGSRQYGVKYSQLVHGLKQENVQVNRKMLADLVSRQSTGVRVLHQQGTAAMRRSSGTWRGAWLSMLALARSRGARCRPNWHCPTPPAGHD